MFCLPLSLLFHFRRHPRQWRWSRGLSHARTTTTTTTLNLDLLLLRPVHIRPKTHVKWRRSRPLSGTKKGLLLSPLNPAKFVSFLVHFSIVPSQSHYNITICLQLATISTLFRGFRTLGCVGVCVLLFIPRDHSDARSESSGRFTIELLSIAWRSPQRDMRVYLHLVSGATPTA